MNKKQFTETYCLQCGTQRCEGIDSEWFEGCPYRWNLDDMDSAAEIKRLNDKVTELGNKLINFEPVIHAKWEMVKVESFCIDKMTGKPTKLQLPVCSHCKTQFGQIVLRYKRCPNCGAHMNGGINNA